MAESTRTTTPAATRDGRGVAARVPKPRKAAKRAKPATRRRVDLRDPSLYANRELSWLDFNDRVLQIAQDESLPLLERVRFLAIFVDNLDDFFMIRVAGVHDLLDARIDARGPDGLSPSETLDGIAERVRKLDRRHSREFEQRIRPALSQNGIRIVSCEESGGSRKRLLRHFED